MRAAIIQLFEITIESCWKMLKTYLWEYEEIDAASPKSVIRECRNVGIVNEVQSEMLISMIRDRNITAHVYGESTVQAIYEHIPQYAKLMQQVVEAVEVKL